MGLLDRLRAWLDRAPVDSAYPVSSHPTPDDMYCPDTQPASPGAIDSDPQKKPP